MLSENELKCKVERCRTLLTKFRFLIDSPLVNFLKDGHWKFLEDLEWSKYLLSLDDRDLATLPDPERCSNLKDGMPESLEAFLADCCSVYSCFDTVPVSECESIVNLGMSPKKQHEVSMMGAFVRNVLSEHKNVTQIIDFGSGKGYLPENISLTCPGVKVLGIDREEVNTKGGRQRNLLMERLWRPLFRKSHPHLPADSLINLNHYFPVTLELSADHISPDFVKQIASHGHISPNNKTMLLGLHACGDLTSLLLQTFLACPDLQNIVSVGCCYHLITQRERSAYYMTEGEHKPTPLSNPDSIHAYPMSAYLKREPLYFTRNALCLASQAPEKMCTLQKLPEVNLFYRAIFQVLLLDNFERPPAVNVGTSATRATDFVSYTKLALTKLSLSYCDLTDEKIMSYYFRFTKCDERKLYIFYQLRTALTRVIESLFLIDRVLYLRDNGVDSVVSRLFDPTISPRCYVLVANKSR